LIEMAAYKYYEMENKALKTEFATPLSCQEAEYAFARLKSRYKFRHYLIWRNLRRHCGLCGDFTITLKPPTSVGILAHEVAHAIRNKKKLPKEKHHNKKHFNAMKRVAKVIMGNLSAWKAASASKIAQKNETIERRKAKESVFEVYAKTPNFKLAKLRSTEKAWLRKFKLATTKLKQIRRKIGIWERKQKASIARMEAATDAWNAVGI